MIKTSKPPGVESDPTEKPPELDVSKIPSPVLARLIEEVRNEEIGTAHAYNRFHNRHNRIGTTGHGDMGREAGRGRA